MNYIPYAVLVFQFYPGTVAVESGMSQSHAFVSGLRNRQTCKSLYLTIYLHSHHLSLPPSAFQNSYSVPQILSSASGYIWTDFTDFWLGLDFSGADWHSFVLAFTYILFLVTCARLSWPDIQSTLNSLIVWYLSEHSTFFIRELCV